MLDLTPFQLWGGAYLIVAVVACVLFSKVCRARHRDVIAAHKRVRVPYPGRSTDTYFFGFLFPSYLAVFWPISWLLVAYLCFGPIHVNGRRTN